MRVLTLLLVAAMAQTLFVFRPVAPPAPTAPPPGYTKAKADAVFNSSFKRFTSTPQALAVYRGRPLVIYFWATWCVPCREETRMLAALQGRHSADELTVLGIGIDQSDKLERFTREHGIDYPVFVAGREGVELARKLGNLRDELPYTVAIDRNGLFARQHLGKPAPQDLEALAAIALRP